MDPLVSKKCNLALQVPNYLRSNFISRRNISGWATRSSTQPNIKPCSQCLSSPAPGGGKIRDPGNKVAH